MRYLSNEWLTAANEAVGAAASTAPTNGVIVDQIVHDACSYRVTIAQNNSSIVALDASDSDEVADARFTQSLATAAAVAQGDTDAHQAFLLGQIRFTGDVNVLIERRDAFDWLHDALGPVLRATTF